MVEKLVGLNFRNDIVFAGDQARDTSSHLWHDLEGDRRCWRLLAPVTVERNETLVVIGRDTIDLVRPGADDVLSPLFPVCSGFKRIGARYLCHPACQSLQQQWIGLMRGDPNEVAAHRLDLVDRAQKLRSHRLARRILAV